jgi:quinol monooxygenase YgiN
MLNKSLLVAAPLALALIGAAIAQQTSAPPTQNTPVYVVSYIEVAPPSRHAAAGLLRQLANFSRKDEGNARFEILQRVALPNHFAIVAIWKDQNAYDGHAAAAHSKEFREKIRPHLISAIDDRLHSGLEVSSSVAESAPGAVHVVTHVDVPPPRKDECVTALKALVDDSRRETGMVRFEVFQQISRPNHFSVVEIWRNQVAYEAHITAAHTKQFREQITPISGALYDERLYQTM